VRNVLAKIQAGMWEPPAPQATALDDPTFHQFASSWLARRRPSYKHGTYEHYRYLLTHHLLPAFAALRLSQLDYAAVDRYVEAKQLESEEIREATRRGVTLTNGSGRRKRPLANSTINATVELLIGILDEAVRRKLLVANPAREKGLRLKEQRSRGNVLEIDELEDLIAAAAEIDQKVTPKVLERGATSRALRDQGVAWKEIARRLGVAEATAIYYIQQHARQRISPRRTIVACLAGAGLRNTELCGINIRDVDFAHGTINVADAKTEAGVRKVDLSPMLRDDLLAWRASLDAPSACEPVLPDPGGQPTRQGQHQRARDTTGRPARQRTPGAARPAVAALEGDGAHAAADRHLDDVRRRRGDPIRHGSGRPRRFERHPGDLRAGPQAPRSRADRTRVRPSPRRWRKSRAAHRGEGCDAPDEPLQDGRATWPQSRLNRSFRAEIGPKTGPKPRNREDARPAPAPLQ
jgi:integrase